MRRRQLSLVIGGAVGWPLLARAQKPDKLVIGWLSVAPHPQIVPFREGMRALGWVEGSNLEIRERYAEGAPERLPNMARDLSRDDVRIVVASGSAAAMAVRSATPEQAALFVTANAVANGLVVNFARPGGKMTGISLQFEDIASKWPQLLHDVLPQARRFAILIDRTQRYTAQQVAAEATTVALGVAAVALEVSGADEFGTAVERARDEGVDGMIVLSSPLFSARSTILTAAAARMRLPTIYEHRQFTEAGGLISYGPNLAEMFRRLAGFADRIARGVSPGDIPVEQPTKFELVINLKAAKALGLTIPPTLLARADEVIE